MYEFISGRVAELTPAYAVIEAAGVGYLLNISLQTFTEIEALPLPKGGTKEAKNVEKEAKLFVHFVVREDAQIFYGFATAAERELFRRLISVSGVGGNTARMVLSTYSPSELANIISSENATLLKNVKGLGLKTAEKIIVELRDKVAGIAADAGDTGIGGKKAAAEVNAVHTEALAALGMLGFARAASDKVVRAVMKSNLDLSVEDVIRQALKKL